MGPGFDLEAFESEVAFQKKMVAAAEGGTEKEVSAAAIAAAAVGALAFSHERGSCGSTGGPRERTSVARFLAGSGTESGKRISHFSGGALGPEEEEESGALQGQASSKYEMP